MEEVKIGFTIPANVWVEVENPNDVDEVLSALVDEVEERGFADCITARPAEAAENVVYVDSEDGEVLHEW